MILLVSQVGLAVLSLSRGGRKLEAASSESLSLLAGENEDM
jgi:hypothetical protein